MGSHVYTFEVDDGKLADINLFKSFIIGGFECSTHKPWHGRRIDEIEATQHDRLAAADYGRLKDAGILTARDGIRWHLIEQSASRYDFSTTVPMLHAAEDVGVQVIWDLCHYGWPDDLDLFDPSFPGRFARFARAFAHVYKSETDAAPFFAPINEISFFAWAAGSVGYIYPYGRDKGNELKAQLVRAAIEAIEAVRDVLPDARFVHADPVIHVVAEPEHPEQKGAAEAETALMFQAWDMIAGRRSPELGGDEKYLDIIGVNFYPHNQWRYGKASWNPADALPRSHPDYKPLRHILKDVYSRYRRPLFIAETGAENGQRANWLRYVGREVRAAIRTGVPLEAICLYPIVNHPGWDDDRHCHNGLWDYADAEGDREMYSPLAREVRRQENLNKMLQVRSTTERDAKKRKRLVTA
ncbi:MAG: beta-glucosidase [Chloroflexota bacterium]|nr:beta-glucosidase [Chloroflexota bacterium]